MKLSNIFFVASQTACAFADNNQPPTAKVDAGILVGRQVNLLAALGPVNQFLGVPFAQSPPERFSPAKPVARSDRRINATDYKPSCIQQFRYPLASQQLSQNVFNNPAPIESEDCLYLNVFAPAERPGGKGRPVMFWIYGGGLGFGNAGQPSYEGTSFAAYEDVIVVTTNYRTNVFGFPGSPELKFTERNLGFLDQRLALDWVQRNIHAFGGDPSKVTIFGESAGGYSVDALLTSYPKNSKPPYRAAILQSGQFTYRSVAPPSTFPVWYNLTASLGCPGSYANNLTCVRAANATTIKKIIEVNILTFPPTLDNVTLVSDPGARRVSGNIARTPVLGGTNAQEGRIFTYGQNNLTAYLQAAFGGTPYAALIPTIIAAYPKNGLDLRDDFDIIAQIYTELSFQCPQALWANATAAIGIPTWRYYFNASFINTQGVPNLGAYHGSEIQLVFETYRLPNTTTQEYALGRSLQSTWARFARNPYAGPGWNALGSGAAGQILTGTNDYTTGGLLINNNVTVVPGDWNLGVFGDIGVVKSAGVTVLPQSQFDRRCALYRPLYEAVVGKEGMPPV